MTRRTILSLGAAALAGILFAASIPTESYARGGRVWAGGGYRGGVVYRGGPYRGVYVRRGPGWGWGAAAVGAAAVGAAAAYGASGPYGYYPAAPGCGYYPYPPCY